MDKGLANELLEKLAKGELAEVQVEKDDFLTFRKELVNRKDFKHFQGIAKHGGDTIYIYLEEERS